MAVPAGGEIAIYDSPTKEHQWRLVLGLDYPAWTAQKSETFGSALSFIDWWHTQYLKEAPDVSGGSLNFRSYGGPLRELVVSRPHWFPTTNAGIGFVCTVNATFPVVGDPVYPPGIYIGGMGPSVPEPSAFVGFEDDAMHVIQLGGAHNNGAQNGKIVITSGGQQIMTPFSNDGGSHEYEIEWDPDGSPKLTVRYDGGTIGTSSPDYPPRYVAFGGIWQATDFANPEGILPPLGTVDAPVTVLRVHDVTVGQHAADGFESISYPAWTSANAGGTLDTAADGERFALDGMTWAKLPQTNIASIQVSRFRESQADTMSVQLHSNDALDLSRAANRPILLDTRVSDESTFTAWKRQGCFIVERWERKDDQVTLQCRDRPSHKLDTFISRTYLSVDPTIDVLGELDVDIDLTFTQVFEDLIDVSDAVAGDVLGATDRSINAPDVVPLALSSGGQSLLPVLNEWSDRMALEARRAYATSGTNRYGGWLVYAWDHGSGTAGYEFTGRGGTGSDVIEGQARLLVDMMEGPGGVFYRPDNPVFNEVNKSPVSLIPRVGAFPTWPWPPEGRVLNDSLAYVGSISYLPTVSWFTEDGTIVNGGVAWLRYRRENLRRKRIQLTVVGHDWLEPSDEIGLNDPTGTGVVTADGGWMVEDVNIRIGDGMIISTFHAHTTDLDAAVIETL